MKCETMQTIIEPITPISSSKTEFWSGVRGVLPLLLAVFPFGMIYGVLAGKAGISVGASQAMSFIVFAGSAQFVTTQLIASGVPAFVVILTIAVVNLRHALYSASLAPYVKKLSPAWKAFLAYFLTDEAYVVTITHYNQEGSEGNQHWFFLGAGLGLWTCWQISTACGVFLGAVVPTSWSLDFALPLTFIALVFPALKDKASVAAALTSGLVALVAYNMPFKLGIITAALVGILVGLLVEGKQ
jgi:4-azaleucine resistance transporter AzlC